MRVEQAYLFRHAVLRDAAYQLQLPADRARLHAFAVQVLESLLHDVEPFAWELAEHCRLTRESSDPAPGAGPAALREKEAAYLRIAGEAARRGYQTGKAILAWTRLCSLPWLTDLQRADARASLAVAQHELGDTLLSEANAREALRIYGLAQAPPPPRLPRLLSSCLRRQNRIAEAAPFCEQALELAKLCGDRKEIVHALQGVALLRQEERRFSESLRCFDLALEMAIELNDRASECQVRINRGMTLEQLDRQDDARTEYRIAEAIARETGNDNEVAMALGNTASVTADRKEACELYRSALSIFRKTGNKRMVCMLLPSLSNLLGPLGELEEAEALGREAIGIAQEVDDPRLAPLAHGSLARNLSRAGKDLEALDHGRMALKFHRKWGKARSVSIALENLAHFCRRCGLLDESLAHYREALVIRREEGRQREAAINLAHQALVYAELGMGSQAHEQWHEAREVAGTCGGLELFKDIRDELTRAGLIPTREEPDCVA